MAHFVIASPSLTMHPALHEMELRNFRRYFEQRTGRNPALLWMFHEEAAKGAPSLYSVCPISCFARLIAQPGCVVLSLEKAMRRRDFIKAIVGSTAAWPVAPRAQPDRAG
jgi:hypothetical protein